MSNAAAVALVEAAAASVGAMIGTTILCAHFPSRSQTFTFARAASRAAAPRMRLARSGHPARS
eukprot:COSAG04_NODE_2631_length_3832_cov_3.927136_5_plen_63_part_00